MQLSSSGVSHDAFEANAQQMSGKAQQVYACMHAVEYQEAPCLTGSFLALAQISIFLSGRDEGRFLNWRPAFSFRQPTQGMYFSEATW